MPADHGPRLPRSRRRPTAGPAPYIDSVVRRYRTIIAAAEQDACQMAKNKSLKPRIKRKRSILHAVRPSRPPCGAMTQSRKAPACRRCHDTFCRPRHLGQSAIAATIAQGPLQRRLAAGWRIKQAQLINSRKAALPVADGSRAGRAASGHLRSRLSRMKIAVEQFERDHQTGSRRSTGSRAASRSRQHRQRVGHRIDDAVAVIAERDGAAR